MEQPNHTLAAGCLDVVPKPSGDVTPKPIISSMDTSGVGRQGPPSPTKVEQNQQSEILCATCEEEKAIGQCQDCGEYLCESDWKAHKRAVKTRNHTILSLSELKQASLPSPMTKPFKCHKPAHKGEELNMYCQTCGELVCIYCAFYDHPRPDHNTFAIAEGKEAIARYKSELHQVLNQTKANQTKMNLSLVRVVEMERKVNTRAEAATQQIHQTFTHLVERLHDRQNLLLNQVEQAKEAKLNILSAQKRNLETMLAKVSSTCNTSETGIECGDDRQFLSLRTTIETQLGEVNRNIEPDQPPEEDNWIDCFVEGGDDLRNKIESFGNVISTSVCVENCVVEGLKKEYVAEPLEIKVIIKDKHMRTKNWGGDRVEVEGLKVEVEDQNNGTYKVVGQFEQEGQYPVKLRINGRLKDEFLIVYRSKTPSPWFIDRDPQVKLCFGSKGNGQRQFRSAWTLAVDRQGNIVVAEYGNDRIQVFDRRGNFLKMWGKQGSGQAHFTHPQGVAVDREGNFIVADSFNHRIQMFNERGKFVKMWGSKGTDPSQFHYPSGLALDGDGNIVVADKNNHRIQVFDGKGNFVRMWGSEGTGPAQFNLPRSVAVDGMGNVVVADQDNHRIQVFDKRGNFLRMWGSEGTGQAQFKSPRSVAADKEGNVVVADTHNHRIQVFDGKGNFVRMWGSEGTDPAQLKFPKGVALDKDGTVVVADSANHRVQVFG